jgi:hypothetical protein
MLAKSGCTMWSGCQGVKSGRFAQDDRRLVACRSASRHTRHDGDTVPGTQRSEQTLRALRTHKEPSPRSAPARHTVAVAQTANSHSQCERQVAHQRPVQSAPRAPSAGAFGRRQRHPDRSSIMAQQNPSVLGGPLPVRESRHGRTSRGNVLEMQKLEYAPVSQSDPRA